MTLIEYINKMYGTERGSKAAFLRDNPKIVQQKIKEREGWIVSIEGYLISPRAEELKVNIEV